MFGPLLTKQLWVPKVSSLLFRFAYNIHSACKVTTRTRLLDPKHAPDYTVGEVLTVKKKMAWQGLVTDRKRAIDPREIYEWLQPGTLVVLECTLRVLVRHGEIVSTSYIVLLHKCRSLIHKIPVIAAEEVQIEVDYATMTKSHARRTEFPSRRPAKG